MNKMEFFKILEEGLIDFPAHELQEILYDYKEHFSNAQSDGKTEEEIIEELGDPYTIVNQYRSNYMQVSATNTEYEDTYEEKEPIDDCFGNSECIWRPFNYWGQRFG